MPTVRISHKPGRPPTLDQDPVVISSKDQVVWECREPFTVLFQPTPFRKHAFKKAHKRSGRPSLRVHRGMQLYFNIGLW